MPMPLYVDLDGTLIRGDTMQRAFLMLLRRRPLTAIRAALMLPGKHRPAGKALIARHVRLDPEQLPWRQPVLDYVRAAKASGRRVVLATGTWQQFADAVAAIYPGLFDAVYATDASVNLIGPNKLARMRQDAGGEPFEYLGDSHADVGIFSTCAVAGWVGAKPLHYVPADGTRLHRLESQPDDSLADTIALTRPAWWPLELLVWLPLLTVGATRHALPDHGAALAPLATLFISAGGYVFDALLAIDVHGTDVNCADVRRHSRSLASGVVTVKRAAITSAALIACGLITMFAGVTGVRVPLIIFLLLTLLNAFVPRGQRFSRAIAFTALLAVRWWIGARLLHE